MAPEGQIVSHCAQYVQAPGSENTGPSGPIATASVGHTSTQVPHLVHVSKSIPGTTHSCMSTAAFLDTLYHRGGGQYTTIVASA
jgi:hypothetical protein